MTDILLEQANEWLVRLHDNPVAEDWVEHAAWLERSPEHRQAWDRAERNWSLLGALGADADGANARVKSYVRRRRAVRTASVTAVLAALLAGNWAYRVVSPADLLADASTRPGTVRALNLEDGSRVTMNGATRLDWKLLADRREVALGSGEAFFEVAHDTARPFYVRAGDAQIRVTGTRFSVRRTGNRVWLELEQGRVQASSVSATSGQGILEVLPGESVIWDDTGKMSSAPVRVEEIASWRRNLVTFRSKPLGDVLDELNLSWGAHIIVRGEAAKQRVTGVFRPSDEARALRDLEQSLPIHITRIGPLIIVTKRE
ncbi:FecR domain-containing protein [Sphingomonas sp.]|uniref:FecR family protein n=1 Tax=Sphingomonas sp. TaxID=28214 RepID=UPI0025CF9747|nr:FecR domain-containing protein [Sphingomonas sp.]